MRRYGRVAPVALTTTLGLLALAGASAAAPRPHRAQSLASGERLATSATSTVNASVAATSDGYGNQYVLWKGQDANLWYSIYTASTKTWTAATAVPQMGPLGSEPSVVLDPLGTTARLYVFWKGEDSNLWMATATISSLQNATLAASPWSGPSVVAGMGPLGSAPAAVATDLLIPGEPGAARRAMAIRPQLYPPSAGIWVFWKGADGNLWSVHAPASAIDATTGAVTFPGSPTVIPGMGPLGSAPSAGSDGAGDVYVFWQGAGNNTHVWEAWYDAAGAQPAWSTAPVDLGPFTGNTGSAPTVAVALDGQQFLYWQGLDGSIYEAEWTGSAGASGTWTGYSYVGDGPLGSQPAATMSSGSSTTGSGTIELFWKGTDANLWTSVDSWTGGYAGPTFVGPASLGDGPLDGQ